jgi:hypothetical protein
MGYSHEQAVSLFDEQAVSLFELCFLARHRRLIMSFLTMNEKPADERDAPGKFIVRRSGDLMQLDVDVRRANIAKFSLFSTIRKNWPILIHAGWQDVFQPI